MSAGPSRIRKQKVTDCRTVLLTTPGVASQTRLSLCFLHSTQLGQKLVCAKRCAQLFPRQVQAAEANDVNAVQLDIIMSCFVSAK
jgi:hypothetical protein